MEYGVLRTGATRSQIPVNAHQMQLNANTDLRLVLQNKTRMSDLEKKKNKKRKSLNFISWKIHPHDMFK